MMTRKPESKDKSRRILSPAAARRLAASRLAMERTSVLGELSYFGRDLCTNCAHDREDHVEEDGRTICRSCRDERQRVHVFRSLYGDARRYFRQNPPLSLGGIDTGLSGVIQSGGQIDQIPSDPTTDFQGDKTMPTTAPTHARVRKPAPSRVAPPVEDETPVRATKTKSNGASNECLCGCGGATRARFVPGHDARLKSRLFNLALDPGTRVKERIHAEKQIEKLGWTDLLEKSRESREAKVARAARAAKAKGSERTPAQKAATQRMRAASARAEAETEEDEDEDVEYVDEDEDEDE